MARTTLESIQHAIEVNSSLALPIALENLSRLTHLALLTIPFNLIHILVFSLKDFRPDLGHQLWRQEIMYAHGAMALLFGGIGLLALWLRRQPPKLWRMRLLILLGGAGIIGFGVAIACIDQRITSNITPLLLACFACTMFILIRPAYAVPFYGLAMLAFEVAMDHAQADPQLRLSNQANGLTAFGLGLLLSLILWHGHVRNLRQQRKLELQRQELEEKNRQLEYLAGHDPLTGLFNRREFDQLVLMELARIARQPQPLSLLMVDLDHFKYINDRYGHPFGDEVIRHAANLLRGNTRSSDSVARLGGEEFLLLLPDTAEQQARSLAEKLRERLEGTPLATQDGVLCLTASFGVASLDGGGQASYEQLYSAADQALYRAKSSGRNRVEVIRLASLAESLR
ncbi:diguanylate cyclase RoeA [Pseudomonas aeruginosa]|uniref:diguanylate cyclase RoeA n=1 Tax=Pseudomonas aeruginosa TaxID=287 RepID=UPI000877917E|nr:diguanylate cyclase RoeA [Pseudomonas aeruginosa]